MTRKHSHYFKDVTGLSTIDVYRVLELFEVTDNAIGHAAKKLLCAGARGTKDREKDIQEAIDTLLRWQEMQYEREAPASIPGNHPWLPVAGDPPPLPPAINPAPAPGWGIQTFLTLARREQLIHVIALSPFTTADDNSLLDNVISFIRIQRERIQNLEAETASWSKADKDLQKENNDLRMQIQKLEEAANRP